MSEETEEKPSGQEETRAESEVERLSSIVERQTSEMSELNNRLLASQNHYETILGRLKEDFAREKQSNVMRYAMAEKAKLDAEKRCESLTTKNSDLVKEKENLQMKMSEMKLLNNRLQQSFESKSNELTATRKEFDKLKELHQSMDATLKATLNHLKGETNSLKEQKETNERLKREINELREVNEKLNDQCRQLNETLKSIPTDDERTEALNKLQTEEKTLRENFSLAEQEIVRLRDEIKSKDEDQRALENVIDNFRQNALKEKENTKKLYDDLLDARQQDAAEISRLKQIEQIHKQTLADNADLRQLLEKEHQFIELTQTLTEKNSVLQSDLEMVRSQLHEKLEQTENLRRSNEQQKQNVVRLEKVETNLGQLVEQLEEKNRTLQRSNEEFLKKNEDLIVEMAALKKKHQANTKDLIKQLQQLQKSKISQHEDGNSPSSQTKSIPNKETPTENSPSRTSRTSSIGSLNESQNVNFASAAEQSAPIDPINKLEEEQEVIVNIIDVDRQKLIDKLIKQQKLLVRRNEKIEFLNDHIQILTQDLQNKRRIIQSYAMNSEGFMYTSNQSDSVKQELAQKSRSNSSSLMATLYNRATSSSNQNNTKTSSSFLNDPSQTMNLETALDIMGKLQSVLEDTLLKNLTLKDNVDTLSREIERLSKKSNR